MKNLSIDFGIILLNRFVYVRNNLFVLAVLIEVEVSGRLFQLRCVIDCPLFLLCLVAF